MESLERLVSAIQMQSMDRVPNMNSVITLASHYISQPLSNHYLDHRVLEDFDLDKDQGGQVSC